LSLRSFPAVSSSSLNEPLSSDGSDDSQNPSPQQNTTTVKLRRPKKQQTTTTSPRNNSYNHPPPPPYPRSTKRSIMVLNAVTCAVDGNVEISSSDENCFFQKFCESTGAADRYTVSNLVADNLPTGTQSATWWRITSRHAAVSATLAKKQTHTSTTTTIYTHCTHCTHAHAHQRPRRCDYWVSSVAELRSFLSTHICQRIEKKSKKKKERRRKRKKKKKQRGGLPLHLRMRPSLQQQRVQAQHAEAFTDNSATKPNTAAIERSHPPVPVHSDAAR
jgi:hypothetical protein